jgi:hypothetical protein
MKLFAGLSRTDYEDLFRAVGALIDEREWSNVSLMEVDEGLIVQVMVKPTLRQTRPHLETYLLTDEDLERVQRDAIRRRRRKEGLPNPMATTPPAAPSEPARATPADNSWAPATPQPSRPLAGRMVEDRLAALVAQGRDGRATTDAGSLTADDDEPLPPMPDLSGLPGERGLGAVEMFDESAYFPQSGTPRAEEDAPIFAPAPLRFTPLEPPPPAYDAGAARAAVVMAHIVAARIKSGVPLTGDDPDLASLLEQVRALDESGIGKG